MRNYIKPSECYFAVIEYGEEDSSLSGPTVIFITDQQIWNEHHYLNDADLYDTSILPDSICESMESVWESDLSVNEVKKIMFDLGFKYCSEMEECAEEFN